MAKKELLSERISTVIAKIVAIALMLFFLSFIAVTIATFFDPVEFFYGVLFTLPALFMAWLTFRLYCWIFCVGFTIRNLRYHRKRVFIGILCMCSIVGIMSLYMIMTLPPVFEDNLSYEQMPGKSLFPSDGKKFSYSRGGRGDLFCDFYIDEQGFRDWIASKSHWEWEYCRPLQEDDWVYIRPRHIFDPNVAEGEWDEPPRPTDGLYAGWGESKGARAVFDRSTNHVYYWTFY